MLQLPISISPLARVLFSMFVPEHAVDSFQLGTLVEDLSCLEPFGLPGATITECKLYEFVSAKVGPESSKFVGTIIGQQQLMSDILGMGVTAISIIVRARVAAVPARRSLMDALVRAPLLTFPNWGGGGNKAYGVLYMALKGKLEEGGFAGFKDEGHGLKFMKGLVQVRVHHTSFIGQDPY